MNKTLQVNHYYLIKINDIVLNIFMHVPLCYLLRVVLI